jgi:UDP-glucose 4-epimerase
MKYLITGGAGFIGSHLCEHLIQKGHEVVIIDNLSTGHESNLQNIRDNVILYKEKIETFDFTIENNFSAVIHLAAQPSVPLSIKDFYNSSSSNLLGTIKIIEFCRIRNIPLIYASSSAVYGGLHIGDDTKNSIDLSTPYATDKLAMELYAVTAYKNYQLSSVGLRFFNVYGPRQDPRNPYSGVISIFADRILKNQDIIINGGHQSRDFIYVNDVVNVIWQAIDFASKNTVCEISNVLTGKTVTIDYLADKMMDLIGIKVSKKYQELALGDPEKSDGTVGNMVKLFSTNIESFTKLQIGLKKTILHIKNEE